TVDHGAPPRQNATVGNPRLVHRRENVRPTLLRSTGEAQYPPATGSPVAWRAHLTSARRAGSHWRNRDRVLIVIATIKDPHEPHLPDHLVADAAVHRSGHSGQLDRGARFRFRGGVRVAGGPAAHRQLS